MLDRESQSVVVISDRSAEAGSPDPSPARIAAAASGWSTLPLGPVGSTLRELMRRRAALTVLEVPVPIEPSLRLVEALRDHWQRVRVLALTTNHDAALERDLRAAGIDAYLPGPDPDAICHAVSRMVQGVPTPVQPTNDLPPRAHRPSRDHAQIVRQELRNRSP